MKDSSSSPCFFATTLHNAGSTTTSKAHRQEKETPSEHSHPSSLSSSSSSSSSSSFASSFSCHHGSPATAPSPLCSSQVVIPFSWEKQPGVPKHRHHHRSNSKDQHRAAACPRLPAPPALRSNSHPFASAPRRKKRHVRRPEKDPFAVAILECSREDRPDPMEHEDRTVATGRFCRKGSPAVGSLKAGAGRRKVAAERFGFVDLYGSCKTTCSVADSAVRVPRSGRALADYGHLHRRAARAG